MAQLTFQPGDQVTLDSPGWRGLVLTVTESKPAGDSSYITAEHRWTRPEHRTGNGILISPAREIIEPTSAMAGHFAPYNPADIPVVPQIEIDVRDLTATDLLELSRDGAITNKQYDAARREDDRRRAALKQAAE